MGHGKVLPRAVRNLAWRFVGLGAQQIRQDIALIRRESVLVTRGVEHGVALIERYGTQILKCLLDARLAVGRERHQPAAGLAHLHLILWRHAFQHLAARQTAIALLLRHLVQLVQLLDEPLLLRGSQPIEAGIVAQQPLLLIDSKSPVLIQPIAEMSWRSSAGIRILISVSLAHGRRLHAIRAAILPVRRRRALAAVILRILLIGPLLVLVRSLLILNLRLLVLVRSLLILILRLLILVRSLLILNLRLLILVRSLLVLKLPLLILVLPLLVGVGARRILDLAGRALLRTRARTILTEPRPHGRTGAEFRSTLTVQASRGHAEKQDRSGDRRRRTHSFRVPGPVHKSFSRQ